MAAPLGLEVSAPVNNRRDYCAVFFKPIDQAVFVDQAFSDVGFFEFRHRARQAAGNRGIDSAVSMSFETRALAYQGESRSPHHAYTRPLQLKLDVIPS